MHRRNHKTMGSWKAVKTAAMFTPSVALLLLFFVGPMFMAVGYSMTNLTLTGSQATNTHFVGFQNFAQFFKDTRMGTVVHNTILFLFFSGIIGQQCLGFCVASLMKKRNRAVRTFAGFTIVAGWVTPEIVAAFMFNAFFHEKGIMNQLLGIFGTKPIIWMYTFPMVSVIVANIWKGSAYSMMMFQAALDAIPDDIVECARIDGANRLQILFRVTLPMIKGTLTTTFTVVTLGTLGAFGLIYAMTGGGPGVKTTTLSLYMYQKAFSSYQIGYGMAIALVILLVGIVLSLIYNKLVGSRD